MTQLEKTPWSSVGYITYKRTYSRRLQENTLDSKTEEWEDTIERVVNACREQLDVGFTKAEENRLRKYLFELKGTVAGRFLWQLGTNTVERLGLPSLQNCAFCVVDKPVRPFTWTMDMLMLGCGVGFNIQKEFVYKLPPVKEDFVLPVRNDHESAEFIVPDTREGWVELLRRTLESAFHEDVKPGFTYSTQLVRGKGAPIKSFGGVSSGPEDLCWGIGEISKVIKNRAGKQLRPIDCLDVMNIIGQVVIAGNVRRSAQVAIGDSDDLQFLNAKNWGAGNIPNWRANSNNSVVCNDFKTLPAEFWKTYDGSSEPYGIINLKLMRSCGRLGDTQYKDKRVMGANPCVEQNLEPFETCVTGDTRIQTKEGCFKIRDLVGKEVEVFNGDSWSKTTPFIAKPEDEFLRVHISDGSYVDVTKYHEFSIRKPTGSKYHKVRADELVVGDRLPKFTLEEGVETYDPMAYTLGVFCGDGYVDYTGKRIKATKFQPKVCVAESKKILFEHIKHSDVYTPPSNSRTGQRIMSCKVPIDPMLAVSLRDKSTPLPDFIMGYGKQDALNFIAGMIDTDGTCRKNRLSHHYEIFGTSEAKLRDLQLLCRRAGINHSTLRVEETAGTVTNKGTRNFDIYVLTIPSFECADIPTKLKRASLFGQRFKNNPAYVESEQIDSASVQYVSKIETLSDTQPSYCFSEPITHMGVFGNVLTYQCCLAEVFLPNITSEKELVDVCELLYRINKHSLRLSCHNKETEAVVHKNMRMGIGMTGYLQASEEQRGWLSSAYEKLRQFDVEYSAEHKWPVSIKLSTIKPSGTLSLLPGVTPGIHPGYAHHMIRRIRMASNHALVAVCKEKGYHVEYVKGFDGQEDRGTVVVEFPFAYPKNTVVAKDMNAIKQLEVVKRAQTEWSDNAVSCTVYYRPEELPEIREYLSRNWNKCFKSLSFLLHSEHGFVQAPFEEISEVLYNEIVAKTELIDHIDDSLELDQDSECAGGVCPIR